MVNWELLYNKFGQNKSAEKFENMALDYVKDTYSEYIWKPTGLTRDGNRDFHNLEDSLFKIWGEAKYKKNSVSLTRKDLDPTILSGLIDGNVELIIFVTNGKIPDSLITRMTLGANMKGIKLSFVTGKQLSDWLMLNPEKFETYFEEKLEVNNLETEQLVEFKKISFYEPISLDFKPNFSKTFMNIDDTFILTCIIFSTQTDICKLKLEDNAPVSFIESSKYENPNSFEVKPGLNVISFLVRANHEYSHALRASLLCKDNIYHCVSNKLVISKNNQMNIYYFQQLDIIDKIKYIIDDTDTSIGNYAFFIHGCSGMGKSYILKKLSLDYCLNNDLTLVTFENSKKSNMNYLLLCRIIIFLQYGNIFWNYSKENIRKFCILYNSLNGGVSIKLLNNLLNGCFDANIAKTTISCLVKSPSSVPSFVSTKKQKNFRILLLDDVHYLNKEQSCLIKILIDQQLISQNNNIVIFSGRKKEFYTPSLEQKLLESISNYYELDNLEESDIKGTILQNFNIKEKNVILTIVKELPSNLLLLNEILLNLKYSLKFNDEINNSQFIDHYIKLYNKGLVFQEKFSKLKEQYYLLDIIYLFKKGLHINILYAYPAFNKSILKKDLHMLINHNCLKREGRNIILPYHDYVVESYKSMRKGKEHNEKTGDFLKYLLDIKQSHIDTNYLLSIICKCGKKYFKEYNKNIQELMLQYINKSEYGTAVVFAELFYQNVVNKKNLSQKDKYFLYLYVDCLVHCDNKYRAKKLLHDIADNEKLASFEKYEAAVSLLNQQFWSIDLKGLVEDSRIYQIDLEHMYMENLKPDMIRRFKKTYEACFNRRMVTLLLLDQYDNAQKVYREGLLSLKILSKQYGLSYNSEIATLVMDYARGNMAKTPYLSYNLFSYAIRQFSMKNSEYIRRLLICRIDLMVNENILQKKTDYKKFMYWIEELNKHNFLAEYIKGILKLYACRMVDYSRVNKHQKLSVSFMKDIINQIEKIKVEYQIVLQSRELYLYNYLIAYFYIIQKEYAEAESCLINSLEYVKEAGNTYKTPLEHNLKNVCTIQSIDWFQNDRQYLDEVYLLDSRFW